MQAFVETYFPGHSRDHELSFASGTATVKGVCLLIHSFALIDELLSKKDALASALQADTLAGRIQSASRQEELKDVQSARVSKINDMLDCFPQACSLLSAFQKNVGGKQLESVSEEEATRIKALCSECCKELIETLASAFNEVKAELMNCVERIVGIVKKSNAPLLNDMLDLCATARSSGSFNERLGGKPNQFFNVVKEDITDFFYMSVNRLLVCHVAVEKSHVKLTQALKGLETHGVDRETCMLKDLQKNVDEFQWDGLGSRFIELKLVLADLLATP